MSDDTIMLERKGAYAVLRLNRPDKRNALNLNMWRRMIDLLKDAEADASVRAVVVAGAKSRGVSIETPTMYYFFARAVHWILCVANPPLGRTLAFMGGFAATMWMAVTLMPSSEERQQPTHRRLLLLLVVLVFAVGGSGSGIAISIHPWGRTAKSVRCQRIEFNYACSG